MENITENATKIEKSKARIEQIETKTEKGGAQSRRITQRSSRAKSRLKKSEVKYNSGAFHTPTFIPTPTPHIEVVSNIKIHSDLDIQDENNKRCANPTSSRSSTSRCTIPTSIATTPQ